MRISVNCLTNSNLFFVQHVMLVQSRISFLKSLLRLDDITARIEDANQRLDDALTCFQVSFILSFGHPPAQTV